MSHTVPHKLDLTSDDTPLILTFCYFEKLRMTIFIHLKISHSPEPVMIEIHVRNRIVYGHRRLDFECYHQRWIQTLVAATIRQRRGC